jgi:bifunctional DNase/RNase
MSRLLEAAGATLESVQISALKDQVFYATVRVRNGAENREVDARPSDALALASRLGTPLYVSEDVLEQAGITIPAGKAARGTGMHEILDFFKQQIPTQPVQIASPSETPPAKQDEIALKQRQMSEAVIEAAFA